jgi:hypothetical protein
MDPSSTTLAHGSAASPAGFGSDVELDIRSRLQLEYSLNPATNFSVMSHLCSSLDHRDVPSVVKTDMRWVVGRLIHFLPPPFPSLSHCPPIPLPPQPLQAPR